MKNLSNLQHEEYVLGSILAENSVFYDVSGLLDASDFSTEVNKSVYRTIGQCISDNGKCDYKQVYDILEGEASATWLSKLIDVPSPHNVMYYAEKVKDLATRRKLRIYALNLSERVSDTSVTADEILSQAEKNILDINESAGIDYVNAADLVRPAINRLEERYNLHGDYTGIPCGLTELDSMTNGFQRQELIVVGARASIGKTALGLTIAGNISSSKPAAFFSLEMSRNAITDRLLSMYGNVPSNQIRSGVMKETAFDGVHQAGEYITNGKLFIYDKPSARVIDIRQKARRLKQRENIEILVIDYVGMVKADDTNLDKRLQIDSISKAIKDLSRELDIPVLLLAQLNRLGEGQKPTLSQLKESGSLEEDADVVILLHRDRDDESLVQEVDLNVAKNRNGPTGRCNVGLQKSYMRFVNMEAR